MLESFSCVCVLVKKNIKPLNGIKNQFGIFKTITLNRGALPVEFKQGRLFDTVS
jgi:hypothetical protein